MSTSSRVIKNTGYLYAKMGVTIVTSLLTTRLILQSLGASDFGLFNIIGGVIALLGFLNSTMANATQRFMSFAEGEGLLEKKRRIFNICIIFHLVIAVLTLLLFLLLMPVFFGGVLNIEQERIDAARIVYICVVFSTILTIINVPYDAVMNAHENMRYYSIVGIFEAILKLLIAVAVVYSAYDKLIIYGVLMAIVPLITLSIMKIYCHHNYDECIISPRKYWEKSMASEITRFFGWNFLTAISSLFSIQGVNVVLNHFFGTVLNAAQGIAQQIYGYLSVFSGNMMKAVNPVIVKRAGADDIFTMNKVVLASCKFSTYLMLLFAVPCILEMRYVLRIWLDKIPEWTYVFCIFQIVMGLVTQITFSISTAIYADGRIKLYAIYKSITNILPVLLTYAFFSFGFAPYWLYIIMIIVWGGLGDIVILIYGKKQCSLSINIFFKDVLIPVAITITVMLLAGLIPKTLMSESFLRLVVSTLTTTATLFIVSYLIGLTHEEKQIVCNTLSRVTSKFHKTKMPE